MSDTVPLKNPSNQIEQIPVEQAKNLIANQGYAIPAQEDLDQSAAEAKYGGVGEGLKAAAEGFVSGALPGGRAALNLVGDTPEAQAGRKLAHPILSGGGTGAGILGGLAAGTGEEALAGDAAEAANGGGGLFDAAKSVIGAPTKAISGLGHAVTDAATPEAANLAQRALGMGLGSATEGAAYGLGQSLDDKALGDTDSIGENLLHNVGWSAVLAGGLGAVMAPFAKEASKLSDLNDHLSQAEGELGAAPGTATGEGMATEDQKSVLDHLKAENAEAPATKQAAEALGLPVFPEQISDSPTVKKVAEAMTNRADETGIGQDALRRDAYKKASDVIESNLNNVEGGTAKEVGDFARQDLSNAVEARYKPLGEAFDKVESITGPIQLAPESADGIAKEMENIIKTEHLPPELEEGRFIQGYSNLVRQASSVAELEKISSSIYKLSQKKYELSGLAGQMRDVLTQAREKYGTLAVKAMPEGAEKIEAQSILNGVPALKKSYAEFSKDLGRNAKKLGFGNVTPGAFLKKLGDEGKISSEGIVSKLTTTKDSAFLSFLQKNAPGTFQALMDREKSRIVEAASKSGHFDSKLALKEIDKYSPEVRAMVFKPGEVDSIRNAETYLKSFPKKYFNSGTAVEARIGEQFSGLAGVAAAAATGHPLIAAGAAFKHFYGNKLTTDAMKKAIDVFGPGAEGKVGALSMLERMNGKFLGQVQSKAKAVFSFDKQVAAAQGASALAHILLPSDDDHKETTDTIKSYANNPQKTIDDLSKNTDSLAQFAPNVAGGLQKSTARALSFLNSKVPQMPNLGPLGPKLKPSASQKAIFSNYQQTIENPLHVMDKIKNGTIVPDDLEALSNVYPKTLQQMQKSVYQSMIDHITKNGTDGIPNSTKVALSLFLGQDMDQSLSQPAVAANQALFNAASAEKDAQEQQQMNAGKVRPSQKGLSALNKSQSIMTNAQQVSQRNVES